MYVVENHKHITNYVLTITQSVLKIMNYVVKITISFAEITDSVVWLAGLASRLG